MQCAVIEWARNVANLPDASSSELDPDTPNPSNTFITRTGRCS